MKFYSKTLGEICDAVGGIIRTGPFGSQLHESDYSDEGTPVVMPKDIIDGRVTQVSIARVSEEHVQRLIQHKLKPGDIVYGRRGDIGRQALITEREVGWLCGTGCLRISFGSSLLEPLYLHYYLRDASVIAKIASQAIGATLPNLNTSILRSVVINYPSFPLQRRIASILSAYDDLIENNTRRIAILEEMARRIYEEWFVHFRFPGHEKVRMVDSELGKIPEGWEVSHLSEILEIIRCATRPGKHLANRRYVPIDCIARKSLVLPDFKPWDEAQSSLILFEEDDILFGAMRPYFHKVCIAPFPGITRTTCFVLRARNEFLHAFGVLTAFADTTVSHASAHTQGATIPYAVWDGSLAELKILIPPTDLLRKFDKTVSPMLTWLKRITFKQTNLRKTRDFLLPKLISGEIDVSKLPEPEEATV